MRSPRNFFEELGGRISDASGRINSGLKSGSEKIISERKEILTLEKKGK